MKKYALLFMLTMLAIIPSLAQRTEKEREEMRKEILEFKLKFLAQEIDLKDNQRERFVKIYTQMENERHELYESARKVKERVKNGNATDEDYARAANLEAEIKKKDAEIEAKYNDKLQEILSPKQMYQLKEAEQKFRKKMKEMRREREDRGQGRKKNNRH